MRLRFDTKRVPPNKLVRIGNLLSVGVYDVAVGYAIEVGDDIKTDGKCVWNGSDYDKYAHVCCITVKEGGYEEKAMREMDPEALYKLLEAAVKDNGGDWYEVYDLCGNKSGYSFENWGRLPT